MTQDVDLVVDQVQRQKHLDRLISRLEELDYFSNPEAIREAISRGRMFQLLDSHEALKIDIDPRELVPGALDRSILVEITPTLSFP